MNLKNISNIRYDRHKDVLFFDFKDKSGKVTTHHLEQKRSIDHALDVLKHNRVATSDDHAQLLYSLILFFRCKSIVEIGVAYGDTTRWLCQAADAIGSIVHGFDCWEDHGISKIKYGQKSSKEDVEKYLKYFHNVENFLLTKINTISENDKFIDHIKKLAPLDFVFIDGDHSLEGVSSDFESIYPYLSDQAIVVFHDTLICNGSRQFAHELRTKYFDNTFDIVDMPYGNFEQRCGLTVLFKRSFSKCNVKIIEDCGATLSDSEIYENEKRLIGRD